jgi:hypothetical protein
MSITIHTLNARNNVFLEVVREYFKLSPTRMQKEIRGLAKTTAATLAKKGLDYGALRSALVPQQDRHEAALLFNIDFNAPGIYSYPVHQRLLRILNRKSSHSIPHGDITDSSSRAFEYADQNLVRAGDRHFDSNMLYAVYINNLTTQMVADIHRGMHEYPPYVGYVDTTYGSMFKAVLSTQLVNCYIQYRNLTIAPHEDDRHVDENIDIAGLGLDEGGYTICSVPSTNFMVLLSYKIERPVVDGFEADTEFALNALSHVVLPLDHFEIEIDPPKFGYLHNKKSKSLEGLGLLSGNVDQLKSIIRERISHNYIYSLTHDEGHNLLRFNIMIEVRPAHTGRPFRALVSLEYKPDEQILRFITLM